MVHLEVADDAGLFRGDEQFIHHRLAVAREILHQTQGVQGVANSTAVKVHPIVRLLLVADR